MEIWIIFLSCRYVIILYVAHLLTNMCPRLLVVNCFSFLPIYFCLVPSITSSHVSILLFLLSPPNTLIPPHCLCPVPHTPLLWIVNMALSHSGQRKERRNKKQTEEEKKAERGRDGNWKGKLQQEIRTCGETARLGIRMWEITRERGREGFLTITNKGSIVLK